MTQRCAHCDVPIVDNSTVVQREGRVYCCNNCAMAAEGTRGEQTQTR